MVVNLTRDQASVNNNNIVNYAAAILSSKVLVGII